MRTHFPTRQTISSTGFAKDIGRRTSISVGTSNAQGPEGDQFQTRTIEVLELHEFDGPADGAGSVSTLATKLTRFVKGLDAAATSMPDDEVRALGDPFSRGVLLTAEPPKTVRQLFDAIAAMTDPVLPIRQVFLVAEGGQARLRRPDFELNARLVVTWQPSAGSGPEIMLSTVPAADDPQALMQLIAWSKADKSFHFFERERNSGAWVWAGHSFHALDPKSRGQGPFDSHINGGLVMKELKAPWTHWHSTSASIPPEAFPTDSELLTEPLFQRLKSAHILEGIVKTGVRRWTKSRLDHSTNAGRLGDVPNYLKQLLWCTSVNLVSSTRVTGQPDTEGYPLPTSFFYDFDALAFLGEELAPGKGLVPDARLSVEAGAYEAALAEIEVGIVEDEGDGTRLDGDTHFAFLVPERAFEDFVVLQELVSRGAVGARMALCLILVDFTNPVFSPSRAALLAHVPDEVELDGGSDFDTRFLDKIGNAALGSPEAEFLAFFNHPDLVPTARDLLSKFVRVLERRLRTPEGVLDLVRLADSRRQVFASRRSLAEFRSTLAMGRNPMPHLAMAADGIIYQKSSDIGEEEN